MTSAGKLFNLSNYISPFYRYTDHQTPLNDDELYRKDSQLHKNCLVAQFLASTIDFAQFFEFVTSNSFRQQDHSGVQQLWLHCLYTQHAAAKITPLTPVYRHRLRKRYPFPASIWNGESTSYNMKQSSRRILALAFSVDQYPSNEEKKHLAMTCEMDYLQICNWFKNRRMREKRLMKEQQRNISKVTLANSTPSTTTVSAAVQELSDLQNINNAF